MIRYIISKYTLNNIINDAVFVSKDAVVSVSRIGLSIIGNNEFEDMPSRQC